MNRKRREHVRGDFGTVFSSTIGTYPDPTDEASEGEVATGVLPRSEGANGDFYRWLKEIPFQRVAAWTFVGFVAYQLKDFFGIFMGSFVLSSIGNSFVETAGTNPMLAPIPPTARRRLLVLFYFASIVALFILFGATTIPDIAREGVDFVQRLQNDNIWVVVLEKMRSGLGDNIMEQFERLLLLASSENIMEASSSLGQVWTADRTHKLGMVMQKLLRGYTEAAVSFTSALLSFVTRFTLQLLVSLILSFMLVWDFTTIKGGIQSLRNSRLSAVYYEVAPSLQVFGKLFGKALQAQARIACVNTLLTAIGLCVLRIPNVGLLSLFVFICGFIPVAGVFMSTSPMAFIALTEYGFMKLAATLVLVTGIHFVEAYALNPLIYSAHLKLHPLLVLSAIVIAEHSLGVWGLMLAVPLSVFALDYVIRFPKCTVPEVAAKELRFGQKS